MFRISTEFERVSEESVNTDSYSLFDSKHKKIREMLTLGSACHLLKAGGYDSPEFAEYSESPDFKTFKVDGTSWGDIELVDVVDPRIPRHASFKPTNEPQKPKRIGPPLKEPWAPLRDIIAKKAKMGYAAKSVLLVYFDIWTLAFPDRPEFTEALVSESLKNPFEQVSAFSRVLVLNSSMDSLVELHPDVTVLAISKS